MQLKDWVSIAAFALAAVTFIWRLLDERRAYLQIAMECEWQGLNLVIKTTIENKTARVRRVGPVFLLIGPPNEEPVRTFNALLKSGQGKSACCAIDFESRVPSEALSDAGGKRQIIPLTYYTEENDNIGDETLAHSQALTLPNDLDVHALAVRFYVYGYRRWRQNIHRKVHDIVLLPRTSAPTQASRLPPESAPILMCQKLRGCRQVGNCPTAGRQ